jgi:hypothetical protein
MTDGEAAPEEADDEKGQDTCAGSYSCFGAGAQVSMFAFLFFLVGARQAQSKDSARKSAGTYLE